MLEQKRLGNKGTGTARSEQTSQAGDEMDQKDDQTAHHRIVAGQKIPTNYGRNNNSPGTGRSKGAVPVIKRVAERLEFHRMRCGDSQTGPMFRNLSGKPVCLNNVLGRQILPALRRCESCAKAEGQHAKADHPFKLHEKFPKWHGWHAARRGLGSNLYALGVPEKVIQQILRHTNVSTTSAYYIKTVPTQVTDAMEKLQEALPVSLSGNEVATDTWKAPASPAVN